MNHADKVKELADEFEQLGDGPECPVLYDTKRTELFEAIDAMQAEIDSLRGMVDRMTLLLKDKDQEANSLHKALLACARKAEALKKDCGMSPESPQAIRNAQYQDISTTAHIALGTFPLLGALSEEAKGTT